MQNAVKKLWLLQFAKNLIEKRLSGKRTACRRYILIPSEKFHSIQFKLTAAEKSKRALFPTPFA